MTVAWTMALCAGASTAATLVDAELATALRATAEAGSAPSVRVIVQYRDSDAPRAESAQAARARRSSHKQTVERRLSQLVGAQAWRRTHDFSELPMNAFELRDAAALDALLAHADVEAVFADRPVHLYTDASLTLVRQPPVANTMHRTGSGQTIAVIDTGVDYTQAGLGSCTAPGTGSGCKVVASYYTATGTSSPPSGSGLDDIGHGTEVSQVALAVAPDARIAAIGVFNGGTATSSDIIAGINWAISNRSTYNIVAINMSLGDSVQHTSACTTSNNAFASPIKTARSKGIVVVAASGNDGYSGGIGAPACVTEAIAVGAVYSANWGAISWAPCTDSSTAADQVTCFSDSSALLDIWAPGAFYNLNGSNIAGTSFASPMVAGAVAVLKAQFSSDTVSTTESRLLTSSTTVTDSRNGVSRPRLDLVSEQGAPANDAFASATALSGLSVGGSIAASGWNYNATSESGEPLHAGVAGGHSVWWSWTAPADGVLTVSTGGSDFDTLLGVYSGTSVSALTTLASNDDAGAGTTSSVTLAVTSGQTYRIAVDGKNGALGGVALGLSLAAPRADLSVGVSSSNATPSAGSSVTVSALVHNAGPSSAASTTLTLTLPAGLSYVSGPAGCSASTSNGITTVSCAIGSLAANASQTLNFTLTALLDGTQTASASVSASTADAASGNNVASVNLDVIGDGGADTPLPVWALALLGGGLLGAIRRKA
ncbi:S8 family serine peptidase [Aquabacterium sp.]|uniref:S8 family serine peptidase n=1 Tax=Aquabacterium sp. TaxID=1872578 RepID=UPI0035B20C64